MVKKNLEGSTYMALQINNTIEFYKNGELFHSEYYKNINLTNLEFELACTNLSK